MATLDRYAYEDPNNFHEDRAEEVKFDNPGSLEKFPMSFDNDEDKATQNKENYHLEQKNIGDYPIQLNPQSNYEIRVPTSEKYQIRDQDSKTAFQDETNYVDNKNNVVLTENRNFTVNQTFAIPAPQNVNPLKGESLEISNNPLMRASQAFQLHQNDITISVTEPSHRGDLFHKHTYYSIQGRDREGEFNSKRSHDDFLRIRRILVNRWPGCYIPSVPPKRVLTKVVPTFLESRRKEFEMFVQKVAELPHLHYSREYQRFLKSLDLDDDLSVYDKAALEDIILKYRDVFKDLLKLRVTPEAEKKINDFKAFLQSIYNKFKTFKKVLKKTTLARKNYYEQLEEFHQMMGSGYEKNVLTNYQRDMASSQVFDNASLKTENVKQTSQLHSIEYIYAWIKAEAREIRAFLETIDQKDFYDNKRRKTTETWTSTNNKLGRAESGKSNITDIFYGKNKTDQINTLRRKTQTQDQEAKKYRTVYEMVVLVLAHSEIDRFKKRKVEQYHNVIHLAAQYELIGSILEYYTEPLSN